MIFIVDKFRLYIVETKVVIFIYHATMHHLFNKKEAKS